MSINRNEATGRRVWNDPLHGGYPIDYAVALHDETLVDWDLRNTNIMRNPQGTLLKVDLASIVSESTTQTNYHRKSAKMGKGLSNKSKSRF